MSLRQTAAPITACAFRSADARLNNRNSNNSNVPWRVGD